MTSCSCALTVVNHFQVNLFMFIETSSMQDNPAKIVASWTFLTSILLLLRVGSTCFLRVLLTC